MNDATDRADEPAPGQPAPPWWRAEVDGHRVRSWIGVGLAIAAVTLAFGAWWTYGLDRGDPMAGTPAGQQDAVAPMTGDREAMDAMSADAPRVPPVVAYYDGQQIAFIHTEVSDPAIAEVLEGMMGSPVPVVAGLADVPATARGIVYVFANGIVPDGTPAGPLGFQPDVFDSAPGDADYSPLREIVRVTWNDGAEARLLTTAAEIREAATAATVTVERTGIVVNAPLLTWPGGHR